MFTNQIKTMAKADQIRDSVNLVNSKGRNLTPINMKASTKPTMSRITAERRIPVTSGWNVVAYIKINMAPTIDIDPRNPMV